MMDSEMAANSYQRMHDLIIIHAVHITQLSFKTFTFLVLEKYITDVCMLSRSGLLTRYVVKRCSTFFHGTFNVYQGQIGG